jgi:hypothetical protein
MVVELEGRQVHAAEGEKGRAQESGLFRQGVGFAEAVEAEPSEDDMNEVIKPERCKEGRMR